MELIIKTDCYCIYKKDSIFKIDFFTSNYPLVNSIIKTKLIPGSSTDELYKTITFKAETVKTLRQYLHDNKVKTGAQHLSIPDVAKMIQTLTTQLSHLITKESHTILGYNSDYVIVINDEKSAFLGNEFVVEFDEITKKTMICCPFLPKDFFFSPEMFQITDLPSWIHYKTSYFSLACLIIYMLLGEKEFYIDYIIHKQSIKIIDYLQNHHIKDTKLYWLLSRCLMEEPNNRSIIHL